MRRLSRTDSRPADAQVTRYSQEFSQARRRAPARLPATRNLAVGMPADRRLGLSGVTEIDPERRASAAICVQGHQ